MTELQRQLSAKDDLLTETRLEALSSAAKLHTLRETVAKLRNELKKVRKENEELRSKMETRSVVLDTKTKSSLFVDMTFNQSGNKKTIDVPVAVVTPETNVRLGWIRMKYDVWHSDPFWLDLDASVRCLFDLYMARLDPFERLGLTGKKSLSAYKFVGQVRRLWQSGTRLNEEKDEDRSDQIKVELCCDLNGGKVDLLAFLTLRPVQAVQKFVRDFIQHKVGVVSGPQGCGKTHIARTLSHFFTDEVLTLDGDVPDETLDRLAAKDRALVVVENVRTEDVSKVKSRLHSVHNLYFLITSPESEAMEDVAVWSLRNKDQMESSSFLGFCLRRKVMEMETVACSPANTANDSMIVAVNWLSRVFVHLDQFSPSDLPPSLFMESIPLESTHNFKSWFMDTWNLKLVRQLRQLPLNDDTDPVRFVIQSWPWKEDSQGLAQALKPVYLGAKRHHKAVEDDPLVITYFLKPFFGLKTIFFFSRWRC